ncbi:MAG: DUF1648 domain-containing protein [Candidatus Pacebacteria bacterium]|nr:DUF1648 domain-containing protein [Candidatus Paceibacterota bacterium]
MKKSTVIILLIIFLSFAIGFFAYPQMPDTVASHWDEKGQVNGYMSKFWGIFLMPIISLAMFFLFLLFPKIDPMKSNIEKFRNYYDSFIVSIFLFLFYLFLLTLAWNLGYRFNMVNLLIPAFSALFYWCGILIENTKRNWFIGIKTPWTISSDVVWEKTHKLGGKLFKVSALIALAGLFFGSLAFWFTILPVVIFSTYLLFYSYFAYQEETKNNNGSEN